MDVDEFSSESTNPKSELNFSPDDNSNSKISAAEHTSCKKSTQAIPNPSTENKIDEIDQNLFQEEDDELSDVWDWGLEKGKKYETRTNGQKGATKLSKWFLFTQYHK